MEKIAKAVQNVPQFCRAENKYVDTAHIGVPNILPT
jgi:hypothetical protein